MKMTLLPVLCFFVTTIYAGSATKGPVAKEQPGISFTDHIPIPQAAKIYQKNNPNQNFVKGKWFDRIVITVFENDDQKRVLKVPQFADLLKYGVFLNNYFGVTHPSQPNYMAFTAGEIKVGSIIGISDAKHDLQGPTVVDLLETRNISWASFAEHYPGHCFFGNKGRYVSKHNPLISFHSIRDVPRRCANMMSDLDLDKKLDEFVRTGKPTIPQYVYYLPDDYNDGHWKGSHFAGRYLPSLLKKFQHPAFHKDGLRTLFVVMFDESNPWKPFPLWGWYARPNLVYSVLFGDAIRGREGSLDNTRYDHYSLLKTVEDNWELGDLKKFDRYATTIKF